MAVHTAEPARQHTAAFDQLVLLSVSSRRIVQKPIAGNRLPIEVFRRPFKPQDCLTRYPTVAQTKRMPPRRQPCACVSHSRATDGDLRPTAKPIRAGLQDGERSTPLSLELRPE